MAGSSRVTGQFIRNAESRDPRHSASGQSPRRSACAQAFEELRLRREEQTFDPVVIAPCDAGQRAPPPHTRTADSVEGGVRLAHSHANAHARVRTWMCTPESKHPGFCQAPEKGRCLPTRSPQLDPPAESATASRVTPRLPAEGTGSQRSGCASSARAEHTSTDGRRVPPRAGSSPADGDSLPSRFS